ncbi:response regulator [Flavobacterium ovatum]|uniref:response regulator n=1 Tax=Flavobacterium ovatum TaxID=1928857 RepID=UPI00344EDA50
MDILSYNTGTSAILFIVAAIIAKKGNFTLARILYLITLNLSVAAAASFIGKTGSVEFILMYPLGLPFTIFSFRREKNYIIFFSALSAIFWTLLHITNFNLFSETKMDTTIASTIVYPISIISTVFLITYQLIQFSKNNERYYSEIHDKREEAIESSNSKSKFLSTMSHEIRTPLNAVIGLSYILGDTNPREDQLENIEALNYSGKILLNLLNNVLDYSKMESNVVELDPIPTDIGASIKQIKKIHEANCFRKGISMNLEIDDTLPIVWMDIIRYNQVINNLVTNAIKFTDKGTVTLITTCKQLTKHSLILHTEVIDTGIGIPEDKHDEIWEAFTQASTDTNRIYGGTGLGLPIVKSIIEAMNSEIKIESKLGSGSRFYFDLELKLTLDQELIHPTQKKKYNFNGERVLLVEDNKINVMVAKQILEKEQLIVDVAYDGQIAVDMFKKKKYDVVLMDIQMPVMDGYTASMEIRKFNTLIPILALSASVFMEVKNKIFSSGMNGFIYKPFEPEDLLNQIEEITKNMGS